MSRLHVLMGATAVAGLISAAQPAAAVQLSWSYSATGVGHCTTTVANCSAGAVVYPLGSQTASYDHNYNAASSAVDTTYGLAHGSANPGAGFLAAPQLHADATGAPNQVGGFSWVYSEVQGVQGYTWTGAATDLSLSAFVGSLDFDVSAAGYGQVGAAFAILDHTVGEDPALGNAWFLGGAGYSFRNTCASDGAIGVASTGVISGAGHHTATLAPSCNGETTFHLEEGETFYLWARMQAFHLSNGFTDASHTFSINISPTAPPALVQALTENLVINNSIDLGSSAPEPSAWALLIGGFGLAGAALRRRRIATV